MKGDIIDDLKKAYGIDQKTAGGKRAKQSEIDAIYEVSSELGINPVDLATAIGYETAGTYDPWKAGPVTKWGQHRGLIQFGEPQRKQYGVYEGQSFEEQVRGPVKKYLQDVFKASKRDTKGASQMDIYSAILAGGVGEAYYDRSDTFVTPRSATSSKRFAEHRRAAIARFFGGVEPGGNTSPSQSNFDYEAAMKGLLGDGDGKTKKAQIPQEIFDKTGNLVTGTGGVDPGASVPDEMPEAAPSQSNENTPPPAAQTDAEPFPMLMGVKPNPDAPFEKREIKPGENYYEFEKSGKLGDKEYVGQREGKYRFKTTDGDLVDVDPKTRKQEIVGFPKKLNFQDGVALTKKSDDGIYTDADGDDYKVEKTEDGYKPTPVTPFRKKLKLEDGTVLTRENDPHPTDAGAQPAARPDAEKPESRTYADESGRKFEFDGKSIRETIQKPDATEDDVQAWLEFKKLPDTPENREKFRADLAKADAKKSGDVRLGYKIGETAETGLKLASEATREVATNYAQIPEDAATVVAPQKYKADPTDRDFENWRQKNNRPADERARADFQKDWQKNEFRRYMSGDEISVNVDLTKKPKGMNLREYLFRASFAPVAAKYGIDIEAAREKLVNELGGIFVQDDERLAAMGDDETRAHIEKRGNLYSISWKRSFVNDLLGGDGEKAAKVFEDDYRRERENTDLRSAMQDPFAEKIETNKQLDAMLDREKSRANRLNEEANRLRLLERERGAGVLMEKFDPNNPNVEDADDWRVAKGVLKKFFEGDFFGKVTVEDIEKGVQAEVADMIREAGSATKALEMQREYENLTGGVRFVKHAGDFTKTVLRTPALFARTIAWAEEMQAYVREKLGVPTGVTVTDVLNAADWIWAKTFGLKAKPQEQGKYPNLLAEAINKGLPDDPLTRRTFFGKLARGAGSAVPFMLGAAASGGSSAVIALMGIGMETGSLYEEAKDAGLSREKRILAGLAGVPLGASELLGLKYARLGRLLESSSKGQFLKSFMSFLAATGKEATEESIQEFFQSAGGKLVIEALKKNGLTAADVSKAVGEAGEDALMGAIIGAVLGGGGNVVSQARTNRALAAREKEILDALDQNEFAKKSMDGALDMSAEAFVDQALTVNARQEKNYVSPAKRREQVNRLAALGYGSAEIDQISAADAAVILQNAVSPEDYTELLQNQFGVLQSDVNQNTPVPRPSDPLPPMPNDAAPITTATESLPSAPTRRTTIENQQKAMLDRKNETAIAVLYKSGENVPNPAHSFIREVSTPDGILHVSMPMLKTWWTARNPDEEYNFESVLADIEAGKIKVSELTGAHSVDFEKEAPNGTAVVTVDSEGRELSATKISDNPPDRLTPEEQKAVETQEKIDKKRHGSRAAKTGVATTGEVAGSRREKRPVTLEEKFARLQELQPVGIKLTPRNKENSPKIKQPSNKESQQTPAKSGKPATDSALQSNEKPTAKPGKTATNSDTNVDTNVTNSVDEAAHEAALSPTNDLPEPTQAQKEAGNYKKGHISITGLDITIENPTGSKRSGVDPSGKKWSITMRSHYGYIKRTTGADEEQIDVFVKKGTPENWNGTVYVIDQVNEDGGFDEHKVMIGYGTEGEARAAYSANYTKGWKVGPVKPMDFDVFKTWISEEQAAPANELELTSGNSQEKEKVNSIDKTDSYSFDDYLAERAAALKEFGPGKEVGEAANKGAKASAADPNWMPYPKGKLKVGDAFEDRETGEIAYVRTLDKVGVGYAPALTGQVYGGITHLGFNEKYKKVDASRLNENGEVIPSTIKIKEAPAKTEPKKPTSYTVKTAEFIPGVGAVEKSSRTVEISDVFDKVFAEKFGKTGKTDLEKKQNSLISALNDEFDLGIEPDTLKDEITDVPTFDEARYDRLQSVFAEIVDAFAADGNPETAMSNLFDVLIEKGARPEKLLEMKPYIVRFMESRFAASDRAEEKPEKAFHEGDKVKVGNRFAQVVKPRANGVMTVRNMVTGETYITRQPAQHLTAQELYDFHESNMNAGNWTPETEMQTRGAEARATMPADEFSNPIDIEAPQTEKVQALYRLAKENIPLVESILAEIEKRLGLEGKWSAKEPDTIIKKANRPSILEEKPYHDVEHVRDSLRFKVRLEKFSDVPVIAEILREKGVSIVKLDAKKMTEPKEWGWRFVAFDLQMPNGQLIEFYAPPSELDQKPVKGANHVLFEKWRNATAEERANRIVEYVADVDASNKRYFDAYMKAIKRMGYASEEAAASAWANLTASLLSETGTNTSFNSSAVGTASETDPSASSILPTGSPSSSVQTNARPLSETETLGLSQGNGDISASSDNSITPKSSENENLLKSGEKTGITDDDGQQQTGDNRDSRGGAQTGKSEPGPSGAEADGILETADAAVSGEPGTGGAGLGAAETGGVLPDVRRPGNGRTEPARSETDGGNGNSVSSDIGSGSGTAGKRPLEPAKVDGDGIALTPVSFDDTFNFQGHNYGIKKSETKSFDNVVVFSGSKDYRETIKLSDFARTFPGFQIAESVKEGLAADKTAFKKKRNDRDNPDNSVKIAGNYYVNDVQAFASGGLKTKFRNNVNAIETLRKIQREGRDVATPEEQAILARYIGWGQFPALFNTYNDAGKAWDKEREELLNLISKEEFESASASTKNAHYTAPEVVKVVWDIVERLGFKKGRVLETSMGIGNFLYLMPPALRGTSFVTGVEIDDLTAQIAGLLFPSYDIRHMGYEEFAPPKGYYDLAISNVPFGNYKIADPKVPFFLRERIHNYFFAKTIENVRPGGLIAFITSTGTLDNSPDVVRYLADKADLVTAIRLPANTFLKDAGTAVVTDLIVLRVKNPQLAPRLAAEIEAFEKNSEIYKNDLAEYDALIAAEKDQGEHNQLIVRKSRVELAKADLDREIERLREQLREADRFTKNQWTNFKTVPDPAGGEPIEINEYYVDNPKNILGTLDRTGTMWHGGSVNVSPTPDFEQKLGYAIATMPKDALLERESEAAEMPTLQAAPDSMRQGSLTVKDGKIFTREGSYLKERPVKAAQFKNIAAVLKVRDLLNDTAAFERKGDVRAANETRKELEKTYDAYVKEFGTIHENRRLIEIDPDHYRLLALEVWDKKNKKVIGKSDIFHKPTVSPLQRADSAETYGDALNIVLNQSGFVDVKEIARLMNADAETAGAMLVRERLAFNDPRDGWTVKDVYLSGEVRRKLREAREAAALDAEFETNVAELEKVQPEDVPYRKIEPTIGAAWIPPSDIRQFMADMMTEAGEKMTADQFDVEKLASGDWVIGFKNRGFQISSASTSVLGTSERNFAEIVAASIRDMPIVISYTDADGKKVVMKKASNLANKKVKEIRKKFKKWVWADDKRRERLHRAYNDTFNDTTETNWNGSHLTFPGMSEMWRNQIRPHIKNAVYRLLIQGKLLAAHEVGTGKTNLMIAGAMELRRLKLAKKPVIACLNANVEQVAEAARELYPDAKILAAFQGMDAKTRKETTTRIMSGDWDMVILTHENLLSMPMSRERQLAFMREEVEGLRQQLREVESRLASDEKKNNRVVKALEAKISNRLAKLQMLFSKPKDDAITFEESGIDFVMVDEFHHFKNLEVHSSRDGTKGIPTSAADRATHMFLISRYLSDTQNGRGLAGFTGTPISNTTAEAFNMQRYLQYNELKARGIHTFDAWAANYGENETASEMTATGQYKFVTAFRKYKNLETLTTMMRSFMDVVWAKDVGQIKRPDRIDEVITVPMSGALSAYIDTLVERAEALKKMTRQERKQKGADNWLAIGSDAKKAAIDMRLVDAEAADDPHSKTNAVVQKVLEMHRAHPGKVQLIFSDEGVNKSKRTGFHLYGDVINKLVAGGIPRNKIIDFSKFKSGKADDENDTGDSPGKEEAMRRLNAGEAWIAIGSAAKLGTGVNVQTKVIAMHKIDVKHRPDQDEQEIGRGHRHGNENEKVYLFRYTTQDSFDMVFYDRLKKKKSFIDDLLRGNLSGTYTDSIDESLDYDTVVAVTASNPLIKERVDTLRELTALEDDFEAFTEDLLRMKDKRAYMLREIEDLKEQIANIETNREAAIKAEGNRAVKVGGMSFTIENREAIGERRALENQIRTEVANEVKMLFAPEFEAIKDNTKIGEKIDADAVQALNEKADAEIKNRVKERLKELPEMEWQKAQKAITNHIRQVKDEMKKSRHARSDYYNPSKFTQIIYRQDGMYDLGEIYGFPMRVKFDLDSKDNIIANLGIYFPSGSSEQLSVTETIDRAAEAVWRRATADTTRKKQEMATYEAEAPQLERAANQTFAEYDHLIELRHKLARIEIELGGDVVPEGHQSIDERMSQLNEPVELADTKTKAFLVGSAPDFGRIVNNGAAIFTVREFPADAEAMSDHGARVTGENLEKAAAFVRLHKGNDKLKVYPFLVDSDSDMVLFDNLTSVQAGIFYHLIKAHPDAEFIAAENPRHLYVVENEKTVGILSMVPLRGNYSEDLLPAMRRAKFAAQWAKEKRLKPFLPILKALNSFIAEKARKGIRDAIANNINLNPRDAKTHEPHASFKILDGNLTEDDKMTLSEMLDLPFTPFDELLPDASAEIVAGNIKANAQGNEIFRRALEEIRLAANIEENPSAEGVFGGAYLKPETVNKLIKLFRAKAKEAEKIGYTPAEVNKIESFANALETVAALKQETAIVYIFDKNLPHELFHQADFLGAIEKSLLTRHTPEGAAELDAHPLTRIMAEKVFTSAEYFRYGMEMRGAQIRSEVLPHVLEMTPEEKDMFGITEDMIDDYQLKWFTDYARKNGVEALNNFEKEELNVKETLEEIRRNYTPGQPAENAAAGGENESDTGKPAAGNGTATFKPRGSTELSESGTGQKLASLPETMRAAGIDADDFYYDVFGDRAAVESAKKMLDDLGIDGAVSLLRNTAEHDVDHAILSFMLINGFVNKAKEIETTDPAQAVQLRENARILAKEHALRSVKAGRFTRAASVIGQTVESVIVAATAIVQKHDPDAELSDRDMKDLEDRAGKTEEALAKVRKLTREKYDLNRKIKKLKDELEGRRRKHSDRSVTIRKALVKQVKDEKQTRIDSIIEQLKQKFAPPPAVAETAKAGEPDTLKAGIANIVRFSKDDLDQLAEVGAMYLTEGLAREDEYLPEDFRGEMEATFGKVFGDDFQKVYSASWNKFQDWLDDLRRERLFGQVRKAEGELLTDEEIEEILGERAEKRERRRALQEIHRLESGAKRASEDELLLEIVVDLAESNAAALAAVMINDRRTPTAIFAALDRNGVKTEKARENALVEGRRLLSKAKLERKISKERIADELLARQKELKTIDQLRWKARIDSINAQRDLANKLQQIEQGRAVYGLGKAWQATNATRTLMASMDLSAGLRQGGFFAFSSPEDMPKVFGTMLTAFSEKQYGERIQEIEAHEFFALAQRFKVDFAMAGRSETDVAAGEEIYRGDEFIEKLEKFLYNTPQVTRFVVKPSERTYTAFLDMQRVVMFGIFAQELLDAGLDARRNAAEFEKIAEFVNVATGRAKVTSTKFQNILVNLPLFAPRYTLSRLQLLNMTLNPVAYLRMPPHARAIVARKAARFYGTTGALLGSVAFAGWLTGLASVNWDDDDDDFLKIKIGNAHYDIFAGVLQPAKLLIKLMHSAIRTELGTNNRTTGEIGVDAALALGRYVRGKLSPMWSFFTDYAFDEDYNRNKFSWSKAIYSRLIPLTISDAVEAYKLDGQTGVYKTIPALFGIGTNTYKPRAERAETEAEKLADKMQFFKPKPRDEAEKKRQDKIQELKARAHRGEDVSDEARRLYKDGTIDRDERKSIVEAQTKTRLEQKASKLSEAEIKTLLTVATPGETVALQKILDEKIARREKRDAPKSIDQQLKRSETDEAVELWNDTEMDMTPQQKLEFKKKLRAKALGADRRGTLTPEELLNVQKVLPDFRPDSRPQRPTRPTRAKRPEINLLKDLY